MRQVKQTSAGLEFIYRRLEAWGYPRAGVDWLRRRRLLVIVVLAALCWVVCIALVMAALAVISFKADHWSEVRGGGRLERFETPKGLNQS